MGLAALEEEVDGLRPYGASSSAKESVPGIPEDFVQPCILVIGLFDGIGGLIVALSRLPVMIVGFVSCDTDEHTRRLMRRRWPGLIEWNDVQKITRTEVDKLGAAFGPIVDIVLVGAGSPCQDLSSLNASGKVLAGAKSALFYEMPRILDRVHWLIENIFSMTSANRQAFTDVLGTTPCLLDAKQFGDMRRPRLYWKSLGVKDDQRGRVLIHKGFTELRLLSEIPSAGHWVEDDWHRSEDAGYVCTLTRRIV